MAPKVWIPTLSFELEDTNEITSIVQKKLFFIKKSWKSKTIS